MQSSRPDWENYLRPFIDLLPYNPIARWIAAMFGIGACFWFFASGALFKPTLCLGGIWALVRIVDRFFSSQTTSSEKIVVVIISSLIAGIVCMGLAYAARTLLFSPKLSEAPQGNIGHSLPPGTSFDMPGQATEEAVRVDDGSLVSTGESKSVDRATEESRPAEKFDEEREYYQDKSQETLMPLELENVDGPPTMDELAQFIELQSWGIGKMAHPILEIDTRTVERSGDGVRLTIVFKPTLLMERVFSTVIDYQVSGDTISVSLVSDDNNPKHIAFGDANKVKEFIVKQLEQVRQKSDHWSLLLLEQELEHTEISGVSLHARYLTVRWWVREIFHGSSTTITVRMDDTKPSGLAWDGLAWDAFGSLPDPYIVVDGTSFRSTRCQDERSCSWTISGADSYYDVTVYDADLSDDDYAGSIRCKHGYKCVTDYGVMVLIY